MKGFKRISSKLSLRLKENFVPTEIPDTVSEYPEEKQNWPTYDPSAYESFKEPPVQPFTSNEGQMKPYRGQASRILPGVPPEIFDEWDEPCEYMGEAYLFSQGNGRSDSDDGGVFQNIYEGTELQLFGPQYGISKPPYINARNVPDQNPIVMRVDAPSNSDNVIQNMDDDSERAYLASLKPVKCHGTEVNTTDAFIPLKVPPLSRQVSENTAPSNKPLVTTMIRPSSCIICTEDFSATIRPPGWISINCSHEPSICSGCLAKYIKSDLESKIWNQIKCPECKILLIYEDIRQLADPETFSRYEVMSFRSAVSGDTNFVWCQGCDFGQLHDSGASQPIIRCLNCGFRSCFVHSTPWHERLTCEEYDEMLRDPDGFQFPRNDDEASNAARRLQEEEDERLARDLNHRDKQAEQSRQKQRYAEERMRAKREQEAEAARRKFEEERAKRKELKRRQKEEQLSLAKVQETTKLCPGCQWPIEKNRGCDHMTCIKCRAEFCWDCMNDYNAIRLYGNSKHKRSCVYHTDNLR